MIGSAYLDGVHCIAWKSMSRSQHLGVAGICSHKSATARRTQRMSYSHELDICVYPSILVRAQLSRAVELLGVL